MTKAELGCSWNLCIKVGTETILAEYNIAYHTPVAKKSKEEIMDILEQCSISSNSLEGKSVFGAIPFKIEKALDFWKESIPICREYIKNMKSLQSRI